MTAHYSMVIQWSEEDRVYVVTLPEFPLARTHGVTYEDAVRNGQEVLDILIALYKTQQVPIPMPAVFAAV